MNLAQPELLAHLLGFVLAAIGVLAIWIVVIEWRGLGQDVFHRAAKACRGHVAKQSESLHERARTERNEENEHGLELER